MAANYDRLFQPPEEAEIPDAAAAQSDYDVDMPSTPINGTEAPFASPGPRPMPVDLPQRARRRSAPPPTPTRSAPAPTPPAPRIQVPARHARHARQGRSDNPKRQLSRPKSQHSHRADPRLANGTAGADRSVPLRRPVPSPDGSPGEPKLARTAESASAATPHVAQPPPDRNGLRRAGPAVAPRPDSTSSPTTVGKRGNLAVSDLDLGSAPPNGSSAKTVSRQGWRRWVRTVTRINFGLSRDEKYEIELQNRIRRTIRGSYEIGVLGLKGGAGKTAVTTALGSVFAEVRGDRILAVDADPVSGNLAYRVGRQSAATIADLVANQALSHFNDISTHTSTNAVNLEVLAAAQYSGTQPRLSAEDWQRAVAVVPRYYNLVLADCGGDLFGPAARWVLSAASGLAIVSSASIDSVRQAAVTLDWLSSNDYTDLLDRACVVINRVVPGGSDKAIGDLVQRFQRHVQPGRVVVLPFDQHIAAGAAIQFDLLSDTYKRKIIELAAALSDDFDRGESR